ncbi:hypothetical protein SAMN04488546_4244 [Geodermatophilus poikilotrophus]|uniref:Nucleotidyl transferase AbiEii toxin, Type IV TA system n=1 Tax=Geodermatophilus poikilotrophus TaxID=1333667 RepID=A0A1I0I8P9_9ACTN|nr:hypothetical protein SAMN04488546_4244 [Geodermatophilus poikilotrophus]
MSAIPLVAERTGSPVIVVGGLAVVCRLGTPYRATIDLDTVDVQTAGSRPHLEILLAEATESGPSGVLLDTPLGPVQVDVLHVSQADRDPLPEDETDRLHVQSHAWAAATATDLQLAVAGAAPITVAVAEPGPIIAMKLQAIMNRGAAKEGTDLLDILRLTLDTQCGPVSRDQLEHADEQLRADAFLHAQRWFQEHAARSLRRIRAVPEGHDVEADDVQLVGDLLRGALDLSSPS